MTLQPGPNYICGACWDSGWVSSNSECADCRQLAALRPHYIVQVNTGRGWRKVRDVEPTHVASRAARTAETRQNAPRRLSSSEGYPHRVMEVSPTGKHLDVWTPA